MLSMLMTTEYAPAEDRHELQQLLIHIAGGEREALAELYQRTRSAVYGLALSYLKNAHDAQDLTQDVYVQVWDRAEQYRLTGSPMGWLLAVCKKLPAGLRSLWLVVTMVLGVIFVWMMVRVYNTIDTVPTWYTVWTPLSFFLTLFIGGPLLGYLLLRVAGVDGWALRLLPVVSLLALLVSIMVVVMQGSELATIRSSVQQASALVPDYGLLMAWRVVLLALALACWCVPQIRGRKPAVSLLGLAFVLILAGEMIGRGVFYGLHMTVGMAVAS